MGGRGREKMRGVDLTLVDAVRNKRGHNVVRPSHLWGTCIKQLYELGNHVVSNGAEDRRLRCCGDLPRNDRKTRGFKQRLCRIQLQMNVRIQ